MSFQDAVRTCLQQKYADFNGRARRSEYWFFGLFVALAILAVEIVAIILNQLSSVLGTIGFVALFLVAIAMIIPSLAVSARRLHDTGKSGWWLLLQFVPFGSIVLLVFFCLDSTPGANQHGPNPKNVEAGYAGYAQMPPPAPQY